MSETTPPAAAVPPGWYDDGTGSGLRWWSGVEWTEHVATPTSVGIARPLLPADRPVYGVWIWLIVLLPLLSYLSFFLWQPSFDYLSVDPRSPGAVTSMYASMLTPGYFVIVAWSWVLYGLTVVFAWRDVVWLRGQGVVRPFAWPWAFLLPGWGGLVYLIGRSVIVRRVAAPRGLTPIWVAIAVIAVGFVVSIVWVISLMSGLMSHLPVYGSYSTT